MTEAKPYETSCPRCGRPREPGMRFCPQCGFDLFARTDSPQASKPEDSGERPHSAPQSRKSPALAVLLALIFPGFGHIYAGRVSRGLLLAVSFFLLVVVGLGWLIFFGFTFIGIIMIPAFVILFLIFFVPFEMWQCLDAFTSTLEFNRRATAS